MAPPTANPDSVTVDEDSVVSFNVLDNDSSAPDTGETLEVIAYTDPLNGMVMAVSEDGTIDYQPHPQFNGMDTFLYQVEDSSGERNWATVTVTVLPVNDPPSLVDDMVTVAGDSVTTVVEVLANDTIAPDMGETLTVVAVTQPSHGTVTLQGGVVRFMPAPNVPGATTFTYTASDSNGGAATATVFVEVTPVNIPAPVVVSPPSGSSTNSTALTMRGTAAAGHTVTVFIDGTSVGTTTADATGTWSLTVAALSDGPHAVWARSMDAVGNTSPDSITNVFIVDTTSPMAPVVVTPIDGSLINDNTPLYGGSGEPGSTITIIIDGAPMGTITTDLAGTWFFMPSVALADGIHSVKAFATDATGNTSADSNTNTFTVDTLVNHPPEALDDLATVPEDSAATVINVLANDTTAPDPGETLTVVSVTQPANGTVTLTGGVVRFTPPSNFHGITTFTYTLSDGNGGTDTAMVTVFVTPVNDPPDAMDDTLTVAANSGATVVDVLANDSTAPDVGETLTVVAVTQPATGGTVTLTGGVVRFTPAPGFRGNTSFSYTLSDGSGDTDTATVFVTVTGVNNPPTCPSTFIFLPEDSTVPEQDLLWGCSSAPDVGETLTVMSITQPPSGGAVTLSGSRAHITLVPNYFGTVEFTFTVSDGNGGTVTAIFNIEVMAENDPPTAAPDAVTVPENSGATIFNVLANDSSAPDIGEMLMLTAYTDPAHGVLTTVDPDGTISYQPNAGFSGTDTFTYRLEDENGGISWTTVTVTITPVNDPPDAVNDTATVPEDSGPTVVDVLANDSSAPDPGETLAVVSVTQPANGTVTLTGGVVRFTPPPNFHGTTTFTYTLSDGNGGTDTAMVTVFVTPVNDPPDAMDDTLTVAANSGPTVVDVLANDGVAPDTGETLTVVAVSQPTTGGSVTLTGGVVRFTPAPSFSGNTSFTYTLSDGNGGIDTASVFVTVTPPVSPSAPVVLTPADGSSTIDNTPTITGTASAGSLVTVFIDGTSVGTTTASAAGIWSLTTSATLSDGLHQVKAHSTDAEGNVSPDSNTNTFLVDTTSPMAPVVTRPADGSLLNDTSPTYTGTAEPGSTVTVIVDGALVGTTTADAAGSWVFTPITPLTDGSHTVKARATDSHGNTSPDSRTNTFTVDTTAHVDVVTPANGSLILDILPAYSGTVELGSTVTLTVDGTVLGNATVTGTTWVFTPTVPLENGLHTIMATATDPSGNTASDTHSFTVHACESAAPVVHTPADGSVTADNTPTYTGTAEPGSTVTVIVDGALVGTTTTNAAGHWSFTSITVLAEGSHTVKATAMHGADHASEESNTNIFTVDCRIPDTTILSGPLAHIRLTTAVFAFSADLQGSTYECSLDGAAFAACPNPAIFTGLASGAHTLSVRALNSAAAADATPAIHSWTVDLTPPEIIFASTPPALSAETTATFGFIANEVPVTFECSLDGGVFVACGSPVTFANLSAGGHLLRVKAWDAAGNETPAFATYAWQIDPAEAAPAGGCSSTGPSSPGASAALVLMVLLSLVARAAYRHQ